MKRVCLSVAASLVAFGNVGCNAVSVHRLSPDLVDATPKSGLFSNGKRKLPGVVYYQPMPFLKVVVTPKVTKSAKPTVPQPAAINNNPAKKTETTAGGSQQK